MNDLLLKIWGALSLIDEAKTLCEMDGRPELSAPLWNAEASLVNAISLVTGADCTTNVLRLEHLFRGSAMQPPVESAA